MGYNKSDDIYFANKKAKDVAGILLRKSEIWLSHIKSNGYRQKVQDMWRAYHGAYFASAGNGHEINFAGEQGELTAIPVNHFRNIAQHMLVMTTANRPSFEARATNTDYKSLVQTNLSNNILEYYLREKRLEKHLKMAVEYSIVMGAGYIKMEWNATTGDIYDVVQNDEGKDVPLYNGDIEFNVLSPFDVLEDSTKENDDHDWRVVRTYKNKYDLAAKYPELGDKIVGLQTKSDLEKFKFGINDIHEDTDDVYVFEFFHRKSDAVPGGRYVMFLTEDIILQDREMPYRILPIFKICPSLILGTPYGYTPMFDILPIQEAINMLYSTVLTNQSTFGVQNVWIKRGMDIDVNTVAGGLNVVSSLEKPEPLNLTNTPPEIFKFIEMLEKVAETLSGINSVARGNPESSLKSGTALALVQSMALQYISGLQNSYVQLMEDVGSAVIKFLQDFAESPRLVAIAGKNNRTAMKEFTGGDIANISRVVVDVGNPLARTTAGRVQIADNLLQYQLLKSPQQYINLLNTGRLDVMTNDIERELLLTSSENEAIVDGEVPPVTVIDDHQQHILEHRSVLADPDLRKDLGLVQRATQHIQAHIDQLRNADPGLLMAMHQQPLPPLPPQMPPGMPPGPGGPQGGPGMPPNAPPMAPNQVTKPGAPQEQPLPGVEGIQQQGARIKGPGLPEGGLKPASMPKVPANLLSNPSIQAQAMKNVK